ncbi:MAG: transcriptional regulator [Flammeovirgaceae bacterium]|nr:transcriptional regulator [Flammeovirgaceae bacterium]MBR06388.1 transcriptional regulator [Rickettsiales bacterium]MBR11343.1 transcriptional regulator [Rickettsiales bacterium]
MKKKILIIEDQPEVRENIAELLELSNYNPITAENGKIGVKKALEEQPELILCDIMMPEMDGYEVLYLISKRPEIASTPFIFLTAKSEKADFRKGMNMGADDYITKPFEEMELLGAIERRLNKYEKLSTKDELSEFVKQAKSYAELEDLENTSKTRTFKKKDILYRQGDFASYAYKIKSGKVKIYQINPDGKEFIIDILTEGQFLGENALIQDTDRTEFAQALEDTEVIMIPRKEFQDLIFQNREVSGKFIKMLSKNLLEKESSLMEMAYDTVRKRTADALMKLYGTYSEGSGPAKFEVSRADLASMVGTATESVIRMLSEFKKDGFIKIEGSTIHVMDPEKLGSIRF